MEEVKRRPKKVKKIALWVGGIILLWVCLTGLFILFLDRSGQSEQLRQLQAATTADFPLHYPESFPKDFAPAKIPVTAENNLVTYQVHYKKDKTITVTQQARPSLVEEVNKIKEWQAPSGKAYVADLEGQNIGFILTDKTLVILSSRETLDVSVFEELINSMAQL